MTKSSEARSAFDRARMEIAKADLDPRREVTIPLLTTAIDAAEAAGIDDGTEARTLKRWRTSLRTTEKKR